MGNPSKHALPVSDRHILVAPETWGSRTDVVITPPLIGARFDRDFATVNEARGYAADLSKRTGLPIQDQNLRAIGEAA